MKRKVPEITENVEDLKRLLRQAKKKHEVQRLNVLYLLKSGQAKTRLEVAGLLGVDRGSVDTWLEAYETGGLEKLLKRGYAPDVCRSSLNHNKPFYARHLRSLKDSTVTYRSKSILPRPSVLR